MTPKEAIERLERLQEPEPWETQIDSETFEALEMGIEALKKQDKIADDIEKRERRTKHYWIKARGEVKCPVCGQYDACLDNYCRHCGTKMEGIREE